MISPMGPFAAAAAAWQNFYLLTGAGAATLIGLMFVAITFGAGLVSKENAATARAFVDPTLNHFVQVLFTACLVTIPTMGPTLLGAALVAMGLLRSAWLVKVHRHMRRAHATYGDVETSDWVSGIIVPALTYALLIAAGGAFLAGYVGAFNGMALATLLALMNGILSAWELVVWMALTRSGSK